MEEKRLTALTDLSQDIAELTRALIGLRRELHRHPELAFAEVWTAATIAGRLRALGLAVQEKIGGTGVVAVLEGRRPGKTLLVRADIDALPIEDTTGCEYTSTVRNRNHACGHDAHSAIVARRRRSRPRACLARTPGLRRAGFGLCVCHGHPVGTPSVNVTGNWVGTWAHQNPRTAPVT
jgi:hypothetical protein